MSQHNEFAKLDAHTASRKKSFIYLILSVLTLLIHLGYQTYTQTNNWRKCIENSNYTDIECIECDIQFPLSLGYNLY